MNDRNGAMISVYTAHGSRLHTPIQRIHIVCAWLYNWTEGKKCSTFARKLPSWYLFAMLCLRQPPDQLKFHHVILLLLLMCILKLFRAHSRTLTYSHYLLFALSNKSVKHFAQLFLFRTFSKLIRCAIGTIMKTLSIANEVSRCNSWFVFFIRYTSLHYRYRRCRHHTQTTTTNKNQYIIVIFIE